MRHAFYVLTLILLNTAFVHAQNKLIFKIHVFKKEIITREDLTYKLSFENKSTKKLRFPKFPIINSYFQHDSDIGYQIYKCDKNILKVDSCFQLVLPRIPNDGITNEIIKPRQKKYYIENLSWSCFLDTGVYKIRFILKLNNYNYNTRPIYTDWQYFRVVNSLMPKELQ